MRLASNELFRQHSLYFNRKNGPSKVLSISTFLHMVASWKIGHCIERIAYVFSCFWLSCGLELAPLVMVDVSDMQTVRLKNAAMQLLRSVSQVVLRISTVKKVSTVMWDNASARPSHVLSEGRLHQVVVFVKMIATAFRCTHVVSPLVTKMWNAAFLCVIQEKIPMTRSVYVLQVGAGVVSDAARIALNRWSEAKMDTVRL